MFQCDQLTLLNIIFCKPNQTDWAPIIPTIKQANS